MEKEKNNAEHLQDIGESIKRLYVVIDQRLGEAEFIISRMKETEVEDKRKKTARAVYPLPVEKNRDGTFVKDVPIRQWFLKLQEEILEMGEGMELAKLPCYIELEQDRRSHLIEEACDVITVIFSMLHQFGISQDEIETGIRRVNLKNYKRGYVTK